MIKLLINTHEYSLKDEEWERIKPKFSEIFDEGNGTFEFTTETGKKVEVGIRNGITLLAEHVDPSRKIGFK